MPPRVNVPVVVTVPVNVIPLTLPEVATDVTVPVQSVHPESLLKLLNLISDAAFLLSVVPFCSMNSVVPDMSPVMSVNSEKSKSNVTAPEAPPPDSPVPAVTPVISPVQVVNPESLLKALNLISEAAFLLSVVPSCKINSVVPAMSPVMSVNSEKSKANDTVPEVPPPDRPTPAVTPVISPVQVVYPKLSILSLTAAAVIKTESESLNASPEV